MFRPVALRWVELLVEVEAVHRVTEGLAQCGLIELEQDSARAQPFESAPDSALARLHQLEGLRSRYAGFLPAPDPMMVDAGLRWAATEVVVDKAGRMLAAWVRQAGPAIDRIRRLETEGEELGVLLDILAGLDDAELRLEHFADQEQRLRYVPWLARLEGDADEGMAWLPEGTLVREHAAAGPRSGRVLVGLAEVQVLAEVERDLHSRGARFVKVPDWVHGAPGEAAEAVRARLYEVGVEAGAQRRGVARVNEGYKVAGYLWLLDRHRWLAEATSRAWRGRRFVLVSGWIPAPRRAELLACLDRAGVPFLLQDADPPAGRVAPVMLDNPDWVRKFELFVRGFGTPGPNEVDPSPLLALVAPLMFGYMFGDVGQGLVLLLAGLLLRGRFALAALFVPAGVSAMAFGVLFGSVFCNEHLFAPLWMSPFQDPLLILGVPLLFGGVLILLSMIFGALGARWRGESATWWRGQFPVLLALFAAPAWLASPAAATVLGIAAVAWLLAGAVAGGFAAHGLRGALLEPVAALLELAEAVIQVYINVLSFSRVGAFALAHAGLSSAVITLAQLGDSSLVHAGVIVLGNVVILALEGLIVSIQTTRLVMFEFFRRFLQGEGRPFRPLALGQAG
jgi:V/A-type H+-transporting ATPase subunit I